MTVFTPGERLVLGGLVATALVAALAFSLVFENHRLLERFRADTQRIADRFSTQLDSEEALLTAMSGLAHAGRPELPQNFTLFTEDVLGKYPFIRSVRYLAKILRSERDAFEQTMRKSGYPQFRISTLSANGERMPAGNRPVYYPVVIVEPMEPGTARYLGLDASSSDGMCGAIALAVQSGESVAAEAMDPGGDAPRYTLLKAVYKGRVPPEAGDRGTHSAGLVVMDIDMTYLHNVVETLYPKIGVRLEMDVAGASAGPVTVMERKAPRRQAGALLPVMQRTYAFPTHHAVFRLSFTETPALADFNLVIVLLPILSTALLAGVVVFALRERRIVQIQERRARDTVFAEKERAEVTLHSIGDAVVRTNMDGNIEYLNPTAEKLTGYGRAEAVGRPVASVVNVGNKKSGFETGVFLAAGAMDSMEADGDGQKLVRRDGTIVSIDESVAPVQDANGDIIGIVFVLRDVGVERQLTEKLRYQASHDALTGLINRQEFERLLELALEDARRVNASHALLVMDLDQFKVVNDTSGHIAGDQLLKQLSSLLEHTVRNSDVVARLGGDEFGVLLRDCSIETARRIADKLRQEVGSFRFSWKEKIFDVSVSIGVVAMDATTANLTELFSAADSACYIAKDMGRNAVHVSSPDDAAITHRHKEMQWVQRLKMALREDRLVLYCQQIQNLDSSCYPGRIVEFLLRMKTTEGEIVSPMSFLPAAVRYNMIVEIDRWVASHVMSTVAEILSSGDDDAGGDRLYAMNLSGQFLGDPASKSFLVSEIERTGVDGSRLCFEVTESSAISNLAEALELMRALKSLGCRFALDDFGSGISSFGYLKQLPVDFLKIDGEFVRDMLVDPIDRSMVEAINKVGHSLEICTIAEFVEDAETLEMLGAMGVDFAQGYFIGLPAPVSEYLQAVDKGEST
ncbi:MAG: EAL domain-containing protein [Pseudomonadota bacterium]|nr:EAL domain-containing protein [Pseudomonadota bacterium]